MTKNIVNIIDINDTRQITLIELDTLFNNLLMKEKL